MSKGSLNYVRETHARSKPFQRHGFEYLHHFGTGHQELVFDTHAEAEKFAASEGIDYYGPAKPGGTRAK